MTKWFITFYAKPKEVKSNYMSDVITIPLMVEKGFIFDDVHKLVRQAYPQHVDRFFYSIRLQDDS